MTFCLRLGRVKFSLDIEKKEEIVIEDDFQLNTFKLDERLNEITEERRYIEEKHKLRNFHY